MTTRHQCVEVPHAPARPDAVLQRRGVERMRAILDAAEAILVEQGYEAATLKAIGERAGIPTASVYHYFLDRHQVETALIVRHLEALDEEVRASLAHSGALASVRSLVDAVVDPMLCYLRAHPSCVELRYGQRTTRQDNAVRAFDRAAAERVHDLAITSGLLREDTPLLVMLLAFEVGSHLFDVAFRRTPVTGDDTTLHETRILVSRYLEAHTPERSVL